MDKKTTLTLEQKLQHLSVLNAANHNLTTTIDQLTTLDQSKLDSTLEALDTAAKDLSKVIKSYE